MSFLTPESASVKVVKYTGKPATEDTDGRRSEDDVKTRKRQCRHAHDGHHMSSFKPISVHQGKGSKGVVKKYKQILEIYVKRGFF